MGGAGEKGIRCGSPVQMVENPFFGHGADGVGHGKCLNRQALEEIISFAYYPNFGRAENIGTF